MPTSYLVGGRLTAQEFRSQVGAGDTMWNVSSTERLLKATKMNKVIGD